VVVKSLVTILQCKTVILADDKSKWGPELNSQIITAAYIHCSQETGVTDDLKVYPNREKIATNRIFQQQHTGSTGRPTEVGQCSAPLAAAAEAASCLQRIHIVYI